MQMLCHFLKNVFEMAKGDLGVYSIHVICAGKNTSTENKELDQVLHFIISLG